MSTCEPTGQTRHRAAYVKEGLFSRRKIVFILQIQVRKTGISHGNGPNDSRDYDITCWIDADKIGGKDG